MDVWEQGLSFIMWKLSMNPLGPQNIHVQNPHIGWTSGRILDGYKSFEKRESTSNAIFFWNKKKCCE
jgi:hypothetical protein